MAGKQTDRPKLVKFPFCVNDRQTNRQTDRQTYQKSSNYLFVYMTNDLTKYLKECLSLYPAFVSAERPEKYQFKHFMFLR